ncbi:hypothetical protein ColTof4_04661 [Colletotrichum tofieldiae]|nr:hypothetical protein ColTof3_11096 [Colletotrichum tofieldiae]GKT72238.1 hypothetical protein ColTof4_04661 [Colletotrichum tofieldiae]GKT89949.1 hypothetical protein Ct61P_07799 [Colletotrichum tofieldiae]
MPSDAKDKQGNPVREGDTVFTPFRAGRHEGTVEKIVANEEGAHGAGVKNPPRHGHNVAQNPGTLRHVDGKE